MSHQAYFDTLKRIANYQTPEELRRSAERDYGLGYEETLEMAYENVLEEDKRATHRRRRPKT